ncbi:MAG: methionine--tRNA ligase, partial [Acidobacteria bacterium]|nr:methionine--tRNA ligase [Acidobacteriota bacterium]
MMPKFYLTTPLYYVNAAPHLGHAYSTIVADTIRRFKKMQGYDAFLLTGTDEHGQKVERSAKAAGLSPQEFADRVASLFRNEWRPLGIEFDSFIRTTDEAHKRGVLELWSRLMEARTPDGRPAIYSGKYAGWYCQGCEAFKDDSELRQPGNLCLVHENPCDWTEESNFFFRLSAFQEALLAHYDANPEFIRPETRRNEVTTFVRSGLRDLSISRTSIQWGIPMPKVPGEAADHVFYVWLDALTGYLSGIGYGQTGEAAERFQRLWPADLQLVGKEILRFHAVYWPAFLIAAGLPLPRALFAHGWLLFEEGKMSKSRGNIVQAEPIRELLGADALRYFLLREIPFGQDGSFSFDALLHRYNSDLANDFGNLASRVLTMIGRYFHQEIPYPSTQRTEQDRQILDLATQTISRYATCFEQLDFSSGLEAVWELIAVLNKYLVETEPWTLAEKDSGDDRALLANILYTSAEALRIATALLAPVMPQTTAKIWQQLGLTSDLSSLTLEEIQSSHLPVGEKIGKVEAVFPRLQKEETLQKLRLLQEQVSQKSLPGKAASAQVSGPPPVSPEKVLLEDFLKLDLRVGEIRTAEPVKGASKLLRLEVDIGTEVRQIVAGIAEAYPPEALIGKKVVIVANLEPRKFRGIESNGMIVAASVGKEDRPVLVTFAEDVPNGAR